MITIIFRHTLYRAALLGLLLSGLSLHAAAETRYVTDVLQLSLYEEINSQGKLLLRLNSGTELELLETSGFYARVRTLDGVEGWLKAGFLIEEKPAQGQLLDLKNENASLRQQLEQLQQELDTSRTELAKAMNTESQAQAELAARLKGAEKTANTVIRLQEENEALRLQLGSDRHQIPIEWGMIAALVSLLLGIIAGITFFDYRSRKRHGGCRIY